jgi:chemotaxis protein methyltransferase CheR
MQTATSAHYDYLRGIVFTHSRNVLDPSRDYLFETRLSRLLRNQGMTQVGELADHLRARPNPELERAVADAMTINETSFFRDTRPFELLRTELLPQLIEARRNVRTLRFWSAACSTGQEAYSLAMLMIEHFPMLTNWRIQIEGTDYCAEVVERARAGQYHRIEINRGLPARNVVRFFDHVGEEWVVKPELKKLCNFRQGNLCATPLPFNRASDAFDVIFLRNVMLYFGQETRKTLLAGIHRLLPADGLLFLGSSEQPAEPSLWTATLAGGTCYFRPRQPN